MGIDDIDGFFFGIHGNDVAGDVGDEERFGAAVFDHFLIGIDRKIVGINQTLDLGDDPEGHPLFDHRRSDDLKPEMLPFIEFYLLPGLLQGTEELGVGEFFGTLHRRIADETDQIPLGVVCFDRHLTATRGKNRSRLELFRKIGVEIKFEIAVQTDGSPDLGDEECFRFHEGAATTRRL